LQMTNMISYQGLVRTFPSNTDRIQVGLPANNTQIAALDEGVGVLAYRVVYVPSADWVKGTNDITAGKVSSNATFTMTYQ
ncbi:MAG: hypothetical protein ACTMIX_06320, partial [Kluyvera intermedia]